MIYVDMGIHGAVLVKPEPHADDRGFFARTFDAAEFSARGLRSEFPQCSVSFNRRAGTLRGMHFQTVPHEEAKLVRCTAGAIYDVLIDLRPHSATFRQWVSTELTADNRHALYVPEGCAHGFQTLVDASEVFYQISTPYCAAAARGVRWDDPAFAIRWPEVGERVISERDNTYPNFYS